jgi:protein-tyrosine phosphatase
MIDIHHHCLPRVDDGPREWDEAVEMCRMAFAEGIETIIATPHVLRGRWKPVTIPELTMRLDGLRSRVGNQPRLVLGSEYFFGHDMVEVLEAGDAIVPLAGSRYVLIELAANSVPPMLEQPFYRLQLAGWIPIIAHPERNLVFQRQPEVLAALVHLGAKMQITAGSLLGEFGAEAKSAAETFLRRRIAHFVATDAHNLTKRPPRILAATLALENLVGADVAAALTHRNPLAVLENRSLGYDPEPVREQQSGLFTRMRSFFGR